MTTARVLDVGNCDPDHATLSRMLLDNFDVTIDRVMFVDEALKELRGQNSFDLVLVNRLIFADRSPGIDLIAQMQSDEALRSTPVMMVSNFEQAQQDAMQAGAQRGFGKDAVRSGETVDLLSNYLPKRN